MEANQNPPSQENLHLHNEETEDKKKNQEEEEVMMNQCLLEVFEFQWFLDEHELQCLLEAVEYLPGRIYVVVDVDLLNPPADLENWNHEHILLKLVIRDPPADLEKRKLMRWIRHTESISCLEQLDIGRLNMSARYYYKVEWSGGSETMKEVLTRIHQREEAAGKRERAMAYAFSHQWRANTYPNFGWGSNELGKTNWGWSWMDRWIAARPWESRIPVQSSPKKSQSRKTSKTGKSINTPTSKTPVSAKSISPNGKGTVKARKLSYDAADKTVTPIGASKAEEAGITKS